MAEKIAVYPGTFDPMTKGHFDLIVRGAKLYDKLIVAVAATSTKDKAMFSGEERLKMIREDAEKAGLENYRVEEQLSELDPFTALFSGIGVSLKSHLFTDPITESLAPYKKALEIYSQQGVVMYLPYQYSF
jgi:cytidyltransferase-like protein